MSYAYFYIPGILLILLPFFKIASDAHKAKVRRQIQIAEKERREAARREALRKANEEREAKKAAEEAAKAATPKRKPGRPRKNPVPEERPENISPVAPVTEAAPSAEPAADPVPVVQATPKRPAVYIGNNAFAGETVAFTGTLPGMTRREAIEAVKKNGGRAFENMSASTTILVVGDKPGKRKLENADKWIGSCRKITAMEFRIMLETPLTLTPEEFAEYVHSIYDAA